MSDTKDEIVDRVLHSLRDTEPPYGIEGRIVSALQHRASTIPVPGRLPWRTASLAGGVALAAVICATFFIAQRKVPQAASTRSQTVTMRVGNGPVTPLIVATRNSLKPPSRRARFVLAAPPKKDELGAVSCPAPPMPLTEQEKLLLRLAHKGDPIELAMLDPAQREASYADERAQVQQFFTPIKQEITSEP